MKLYIDTETTDLTKDRKLIQFAYLIVDENKIIKEKCNYIKPYYDEKIENCEGYKIHKISTEKCINGIIPCDFIKDFKNDIKDINCIIGHNVQFDIETINNLLKKYNEIDILNYFNEIETECTSELSLCYIIYKNIKLKNNLNVMYDHFYNEKIENKHDALCDVKACLKLHSKLKNLDFSDYIINCGKYKNRGKSVKYIYENDKSYCNFAVNYGKYGDILILKNYVLKHKEKYLPVYDINCTELSEFLYPFIKKYVYKLEIKTIYNNINIDISLPANIKGIFIDYLIRYYISLYLNINFYDNRCEDVLYQEFEQYSEPEISDSDEEVEEVEDSEPEISDSDEEVEEVEEVEDSEPEISDSDEEVEEVEEVEDSEPEISDSDEEVEEVEYSEPEISDSDEEVEEVEYSDDESVEIVEIVEVENEIKEKIKNSYEKMKNLNANINDILNVSLSHSIFFGEIKNIEEYINYPEILKLNNIDLKKFIKNKINNKNNILLNPILGNRKLKIKADADLIIENELIDIKSSKYNIGENINHFIQLFIYICLYYFKTGIKCKKITIFNPILGYEKYICLEKWDYFDEIIKILENRVID
jgi:DNA polymerase III epsilon subunit-like protein